MSQRAQAWIGLVLVLLVVGIATALTVTVGEDFRDAAAIGVLILCGIIADRVRIRGLGPSAWRWQCAPRPRRPEPLTGPSPAIA